MQEDLFLDGKIVGCTASDQIMQCFLIGLAAPRGYHHGALQEALVPSASFVCACLSMWGAPTDQLLQGAILSGWLFALALFAIAAQVPWPRVEEHDSMV